MRPCKVVLLHVITTVRHTIKIQAGTVSVPYNEEELAEMKNEAVSRTKYCGGGSVPVLMVRAREDELDAESG